MTKPTLLVLAAGIGSRYGGFKQIDPVGPNEEIVLDYSVFDAWRAGFGKVVFVIQPDLENAFREHFENHIGAKLEIDYVHQTLGDLPGSFPLPEGRQKPWGTGHAILTAADLIQEPFVVINGDDYYGGESFKVVANYYNNGTDNFSMVAFQLDKTLSIFGGVTRGLCTVENGSLSMVVETENLQKTENY